MVEINYIAVSNAHGWGRGATEEEARKYAVRNSAIKRSDPRLRVSVWPCKPDAYVDNMGVAYGVTGDGKEYRPLGAVKWGLVRIAPTFGGD